MVLAGTVIVAAGLMLSPDRNSVASVAIISGSVLIGVGALLPWPRGRRALPAARKEGSAR